jgi:hypothetical protein
LFRSGVSSAHAAVVIIIVMNARNSLVIVFFLSTYSLNKKQLASQL